MRKRLLALMALMTMGVVACAGDDDDDDDGGTPATISGAVNGANGGASNVPLVGATVEEVGTSNTATSASGGVFTITVDAGETVFLRASAASYYPLQRGVIAPAAGVTGIELNMPSTAIVNGVSGALGLTIDPTKGIINVNFGGSFTSTAGGFSATIAAATEGAFTFDSSGNPVIASATIPNGENTLIYYNVDAGNTTVVANSPGAITCTKEFAITDELVTAATLTDVRFDCAD